MKNQSVVVFDLDDVLLDTESNLEWLNRAFRKTLKEHDIEVTDENLQKIHSRNLNRFSKICEEFGIQKDVFWNTRNKYYIEEKINAMRFGELVPFPDVKSLYKIKGKYDLAIVSDSPQEIVEFFVREFGCEDLFECIVGRGNRYKDLQKLKPSYFPFYKLMENIQCEKLFYVGDSKKDRDFAKNNKMEFIFLSRNKEDGFDSLDKVVYYLLSL